ncbi:MAG: exodeoxyribonuclease VII small subunit [Oceanospirillales bacterium]|uniref:Exodeoxyribonuclease 7 small subunit n=1 Tax=Marinobacterium halophilum TaxID=267374 RepID=A0A2P8EXG3_9GAMM|nr:exodeoxyribonuclease VII small subunit [Marinobacterium halophilum]MBR9827197.1 exodeoxyribonuclease VII small subunit [Oceanospirillales bacterium]PSL14160.1 exodeoxyribonuclease VII small subunit [Marinobacterium halophilum]
MARKPKTPDFEQALQQLEGLVEQLEQGDLPIEDALKAFEEGIRLTRDCQGILQQAEQKVQLLTEQDGEIEVTDFPGNGAPSA